MCVESPCGCQIVRLITMRHTPSFDPASPLYLQSRAPTSAKLMLTNFLIKDIPGIAPKPAGTAEAKGWQQRASPFRYVIEQRVLCPGVSGDGAAFVNELQWGAQHKVSTRANNHSNYAHTFRLKITCPSGHGKTLAPSLPLPNTHYHTHHELNLETI